MGIQTGGTLSPWLRARRINAVRPHLRGRVLDVGCGTGLLSECAPREGYLGVDHDAASLAAARREHPHAAFAPGLPENGSFDTIALLAVIEHIPDPAAFLRRLTGLLAPGGRMVLTTPHPAFEIIHTIGGRLGLFSREAGEDHETLINATAMAALARDAGLTLATARRFLFGVNQLFVLERR
ncbi:MAG: class I SAM-dependent methyltransferase [Desulfovibrionaceae bacterium]